MLGNGPTRSTCKEYWTNNSLFGAYHNTARNTTLLGTIRDATLENFHSRNEAAMYHRRSGIFHIILSLFHYSSADPPTALAAKQFRFFMCKIDEATISSARSFVHLHVYFVAMLGRIIATTTAINRHQKQVEPINYIVARDIMAFVPAPSPLHTRQLEISWRKANEWMGAWPDTI